jgi:hypothetical protein
MGSKIYRKHISGFAIGTNPLNTRTSLLWYSKNVVCSSNYDLGRCKLKSGIFLEDLQPSEITNVRHTFQVTGMADDGERLTGAQTMDRYTACYEYILHTARGCAYVHTTSVLTRSHIIYNYYTYTETPSSVASYKSRLSVAVRHIRSMEYEGYCTLSGWHLAGKSY